MTRRALVFAAALLLLCALSCSAKTVYVKWDSIAPTPTGISWNAAFRTVQEGLNAAVAGDEVWVARGTYVGAWVTLKPGVSLLGGYAGSGITRNIAAYPTILDGNQAGPVVACGSSGTGASRIDGFTIRNGKATDGGGILTSYAALTVSNNTITGNRATSKGGGISCSSSPTITNNVITGNSAPKGGAIFCRNASTPTITNNVITGNSASNGAGIYCDYSSPTVANNMIRANSASSFGGGVHCDHASAGVTGNTISGNSAAYGGGGAYCTGSPGPEIAGNRVLGNSDGITCDYSPATVTNNTVSGNGAAGIACYSCSPAISNNITAFNSRGISGGSPVLRNNCVYGNADGNYASGILPGAGDISADPMLAGAQYGGVHIQPGSPCIGAGWNDAPGIPALDMDGQPRVQGGTVDIGADESDGATWPAGPYAVVRVSPAGDDANDGSSWALAKKTVQAGIDTASSLGGEVWVQAGVYVEQAVLHPYAFVYGGFSGIEASKIERSWPTNETILDGGDGGIVVTARAGYRAGALDGLTIRNGSSGGVYCTLSSPVISNCVITANSGGGLRCSSSSPEVVNTAVTGNSGNGISCDQASPSITNCTITGNSGSGMYGYHSSPDISNSIVAFNSFGFSWESPFSAPELRNNCVYGNLNGGYVGVQPGPGDITADPLLADRDYGGIHIQPNSPCVDAGFGGAPGLPSADIDGEPRVQGGAVDIGADESDGAVQPPVSHAAVRVSPTGDDANDGSSWAMAKRTVQAGIDAAAEDGGEVWVCTGTYHERIILRLYAYVYGGFEGDETARSERDWTAHQTILDGDAGGSVVTPRTGQQLSALDGFTIQNGSGSEGGGIRCFRSSPVIANNTITGNTASSGGAIYCYESCPVLAGNIIAGNYSGVFLYGSAPRISGNSFTANNRYGIYCSHSSAPAITGNAISGLGAAVASKGIYCYGSSDARITNNVITGNGARGIECYYLSEPTITGNTIVGNSSTGDGGGMYFDACQALVSNNIVAFNSSGIHVYLYPPTLRGNNVFGNTGCNYSGISAGTGDISADPLFVDRASGDYHIQLLSPCVNAGWNDAPELPETDMDGENRITYGTADIGADEFSGLAFGFKESKMVRDDMGASLSDCIVTASFEGFFYIEAEDRSCGVRVEKAGHGVQAGDKVHVTGALKTNADGERYIEASSVEVTGTGGIAPLHINARALGGGDWFYNPTTGAGQCGVAEGLGLNNIGLLVTTWGKLAYLNGSYSLGKTAKILTEGMGLAGEDTYVRVTGVVSCYRESDGLHPTILPTEITPLQ